MDENFVGYLIGALDEPTKLQVEAYLLEHPDAHAKLAVLRQALDPLSLDREEAAPPAHLAARTLARIAEYACTPVPRSAELPQAPPLSRATVAGGRSWWRRADVLVAASILITFVGLSAITLQRMQGPSSSALVLECKNNLRLFFSGLKTFRDLRGTFPDVAKESPRDVAGMVVPILYDAGTLPEDASIRCPGVGGPVANLLKLDELRNMSDVDFAMRSPCLSMCYAYSLGYLEDGAYHGPGGAPKSSWSQTPIMADRPPSEGVLCNSVNHGGGASSGQNVLFADGHVRFLSMRTFGDDDDIFLNRNNKVAAGRDARDYVLGYSAARP